MGAQGSVLLFIRISDGLSSCGRYLRICAGLTCWQTAAMRTLMRNTNLSPAYSPGRAYLPRAAECANTLRLATLATFGPGIGAMNAMPRLLHDLLGPGARGIVLSGIIAAAMSVNSASLLAWSSIISDDVVQPVSNVRYRENADTHERCSVPRGQRLRDLRRYSMYRRGRLIHISTRQEPSFSSRHFFLVLFGIRPDVDGGAYAAISQGEWARWVICSFTFRRTIRVSHLSGRRSRL